MAWDYRVVEWGPGSSYAGEDGSTGIEGFLKEKGREGWEVVAVVAHGAELAKRSLYLKRPVDGATAR